MLIIFQISTISSIQDPFTEFIPNNIYYNCNCSCSLNFVMVRFVFIIILLSNIFSLEISNIITYTSPFSRLFNAIIIYTKVKTLL